MAIKVLAPLLDESDAQAVYDAVKSGWVCNGKERKEFEEAIAKYVGTNYAVSTPNGTSALHLSLLALGIGKGDEVLVPSLTYAATAHAVSYTGATPVFVDSEEKTGNIDPKKIKITDKTRAIIAVHLFGNPCDMEFLTSFGVPVIEDACEAVGGYYKGKKLGSWGNLGVFSFYGNKAITTGEGGIIVTNNYDLYKSISHLKNHCMTDRYYHDGVGYNYEMSNLQAALGLSQLKKLDTILERKKHIFDRYDKIGLDTLKQHKGSSRWLYPILSTDKFYIMAHLEKHGIETRPFFTPMHLLPHYFGDCPVAQKLFLSGVCLPTDPNMTDRDIDTVINLLGGA